MSYVVRTLSLNDKHSCQLFRKASSLLLLLSSSVSTANLSYLLATTFSSLRFLFNFTSLQSFESEQRGFLFSHFRVLSSILSLSFLCSFVSEALFTLSFTFVSERFFFVMIKLLEREVEINNTGVTGQSLPPKYDFEHALGLRNSAYAVNLTYDNILLASERRERDTLMSVQLRIADILEKWFPLQGEQGHSQKQNREEGEIE